MATPGKTHGYTIKYDSTVVGDIDAGIANATNCYIKITKDTPVSPAFYNWFMANATKIPTEGIINLTPYSGITYTTELGNISPNMLSYISKCISNNANVTNATTIVYYDDKDNNHYKISVADEITISLNGTSYTFDVIGFNHDQLADSAAYGGVTATGKAGITLMMKNCYSVKYAMNSSTSDTGWNVTTMKTSVMSLVEKTLPNSWQTIIKNVNKNSGYIYGITTDTVTSIERVFLLSEAEIFGDNALNSVSDEGEQYKYYDVAGSSARVRSDLDGVSSDYWTRSIARKNSSQYCCVNTDGNSATAVYNTQKAIVPAFCI